MSKVIYRNIVHCDMLQSKIKKTTRKSLTSARVRVEVTIKAHGIEQ